MSRGTQSKSFLRRFFGGLRLTFWTGPKILFTRRISVRMAVYMFLAVIPGFVASLFLTLPPFLFDKPEHRAYYFFGRLIQHDPLIWLALVSAAICSLLALAIPATTPQPQLAEAH